jgi:hypothetical protein
MLLNAYNFAVCLHTVACGLASSICMCSPLRHNCCSERVRVLQVDIRRLSLLYC